MSDEQLRQAEREGIALDGAPLVVVTTPGSCTLFRLDPERA